MFDTEIAVEVGLTAAVIYQHIVYCYETAPKRELHEHAGYKWVRVTKTELRRIFPFLSDRDILLGLNALKEYYLLSYGDWLFKPIARVK